MKHYRLLAFICVTVFPVLAMSVELKGVTALDDGDVTRIVVQLNEPARYQTFVLENPPRLVVDLLDTTKPAIVLTANSRNIRGIRHALRQEKNYRLVFDLHHLLPYQHRTMVIEKATSVGVGYHIILEMRSATQPKMTTPEQPAAKRASPAALQDVVIVIDPGHGGKDSGAIGKSGSYEKDIVLEASMKLRHLLGNQFGIRAYLTRSGDQYIPLRERIQVARKHSADMFISIHADSLPKHDEVKGASIYMLSSGGASSEAARWLAKRHSADSFVDGASIRDKDVALASILIDFSQTAIMEHSELLAKSVLDVLSEQISMRTRKIESAEFAVLTSPDIPSLMIELGYLSNAEEERRLQDAGYQQRLVQAIAIGVKAYLEKYAPLTSWLKHYTFKRYTVQAGDSLWLLARRNKVALATIRQVAGVTSDTILIGQQLLLPVRIDTR